MLKSLGVKANEICQLDFVEEVVWNSFVKAVATGTLRKGGNKQMQQFCESKLPKANLRKQQ